MNLKTKQMIPVKNIVYMALFVALDLVLTRPFRTLGAPINFGFMSIATASAMLGPMYGMLSAVVSDVLGYILFPQKLPYFPGYALTAALRALVYGVLFYKNKAIYLEFGKGLFTQLKTVGIVGLAALLNVTINVFTLSLWVCMTGAGMNAYWIKVVARIPNAVLFVIIQTVTLTVQFRYLKPFILKFSGKEAAQG